MPLTKSVLSKYLTDTFVETGTLFGEGIRFAKDCGFKEIHTVDISDSHAANCRHLWRSDPTVHVHHGPSNLLLPKIILKVKGQRITFWLDAHPEGELNLERTPTLAEIAAIKKYVSKLPPERYPFVLLDDMRLFAEAERTRMAEELLKVYPGVIKREDSPVGSGDIMVLCPA